MLQKFFDLYCRGPAAVVKYILHAMGIIANARTIESKEELSKFQVEHINQLLRQYNVI
jgi:hypothetical protein